MVGNWIRGFLYNFVVLCFWSVLLDPARRPIDLGSVALIAGLWTWVESVSSRRLSAPSRQRRGLSAWLLTGATGLLTVLALSAPARLALWHLLGGVHRSGPAWAVAAAGCAILTGIAWRQAIISDQPSHWPHSA